MQAKPQRKATTAIALAEARVDQCWSDELEVWVYSGLLTFWRRALPTDSGIYTLIQARICQVLGSAEEPEWQMVNQRWQQLTTGNQAAISAALPLLQLVKDYQLNAGQLFTLALVGLVETSHWLNLILAELQAPDNKPRPCVHLVCALLDCLFGETQLRNALDVAEQPLINEQVLMLMGDVPLPLQRLYLNPFLWSILVGRSTSWPQCRLQPLSAQPDWLLPPSALAELPSLAGLLTDNSSFQGVVVRGTPHTGRGLFSQRLAAAMQLTAIDTPLEVWRDQPVFAIACRYARWLPVLRPKLAPADALRFSPSRSPLVVILGSDGAVEGDMLEVALETPNQAERLVIWQQALAEEADPALCRQLAASALLSARSIQLVAEHACQLARRQQLDLALTHIAEARRKRGADKLRLLAQPITRQVSAEALVLPNMVEQALDTVVLRACKRESLWERLGDTLKVTPNPGVRVLFVGESGTGKTLAASYIATRLGSPLYRVDLSAVMNKYIGESEKNLAQLLDQAAASDVVLLFDEADALFGNRGEGQENGERFANMLTNFLLTRIESHPGIVILTTNSRERIDNAFTRRLDSIVEFPLPGFEERLHLWRSHFGERGPGEDVYRHLASICDLAGGQVRNVVLTAAAYAQDNTITNANLLEGLRAEYRKQGRDLPKKLEGLA